MVRKKNAKSKSRSKNSQGDVIRVRLPKKENGEVLGQIIQLLGGNLLLVRCVDEKVRKIRIPGKYRKRMWSRTGDIVIIIPEFGLHPDERGTLEHRYRKNEAQFLYDRGLIPEEYITSL